MTFVSRRITSQLMSIDLRARRRNAAHLRERGGGTRPARRHLRAVHQSLTQAETMAMIREKIRDELPTLLNSIAPTGFW